MLFRIFPEITRRTNGFLSPYATRANLMEPTVSNGPHESMLSPAFWGVFLRQGHPINSARWLFHYMSRKVRPGKLYKYFLVVLLRISSTV